MELFSVLLALCEGNPVAGGFPTQRPVTRSFDFLIWSAPEKAIEQKIETLVIWDAIAPIMTSVYCYKNSIYIWFGIERAPRLCILCMLYVQRNSKSIHCIENKHLTPPISLFRQCVDFYISPSTRVKPISLITPFVITWYHTQRDKNQCRTSSWRNVNSQNTRSLGQTMGCLMRIFWIKMTVLWRDSSLSACGYFERVFAIQVLWPNGCWLLAWCLLWWQYMSP